MGGSRSDFFVSHAGADRAWAEWVAWQLTDAGYSVELDVWDWAAGENFITKISDALDRCDRVLALWSAEYFTRSRYTTQEWSAASVPAPGAERGRLVPLRVEEVPAEAVPGILRPLLYWDLFGLSQDEAREVLLAAVRGPARPGQPPAFPDRGGPVAGPGGAGLRLPGTLPAVWNVPTRNLGFTGRDLLLVRLREALLSGDRAVVQALYGMGGVGKTQLAAEYAHQFAGSYDLAWWIDSEQPGLIGDHVAALAVRLGAAAADTPVSVAAQAALAELRGRSRWLLVFDNAADPTDITDWLPGGGGHVLITTRTTGWREVAAVPVEVDVLARAESVAILQSRVADLPRADADQLAAELADLPLAIAQAAGFMAETGTPAAQYLDLLLTQARQLLDQGIPGSYPRSLAAATKLIADRLDREDPAAAQLASVCAFLAAEPIPEDLFTSAPDKLPDDLAARAANPLTWRQSLAHLTRQSLARIDQRGLQMHRLTQAILRDRPDQERWAAAAVKLIANAFPSSIEDFDDPRQWPRYAQLLPHARVAAEHACKAGVAQATAAHLFRWAGSYLGDRGEYPDARDLLERSLKMTEAVREPRPLEVAYVLSALGYVLQKQGQLDAAYRTHERALKIYKAHLPPDHVAVKGNALDCDIGRALNNLGLVRCLQGDLPGARDYLEPALRTNETAFGPDHPEVASTLNNLGQVLYREGDLAGARRLHERALAIKEADPHFGPDSPSVAETLNYLGVVLRDLGDLHGDLDELRAARDDHQRAWNIFQAAHFPPEHPDVRATRKYLRAVQQALDEQAGGATEPPSDTPPRE